jgi:hypothetical protein
MSESESISRPPLSEFFSRPPVQRMEFVMDLVRKISIETEPEGLVRTYGQQMQSILKSHRTLSLSRRDLQHPHVRITRGSRKTCCRWLIEAYFHS